MAEYDVAVVGLGAVGSAVLYQLAGLGVRVVGIDRFDPPHAMGSSHGESRITRLSVGEGESLAPLVARSHLIWRELEAASGVELMRRTGGLTLAGAGIGAHHGRENFLVRCVAVAERFGIAHQLMDAEAIERRFPQFGLQGDERGFFEPEAGLLHPERCVRTQLDMAQAKGATIHRDTKVARVVQHDGAVRIETDAGDSLTASRCVVTAGPWIGQLTGDRMAAVTPAYRQSLHWFETDTPADHAPDRFPVFIWMHGAGQEDYFYGFPQLDGHGVKVASERYATPTDPDQVDRNVPPAESADLYRRHVQGRLPGVSPRVLRAAACLYTVTPDRDFIVDWLPHADRILAVSACSGHGFKHSAGLGESVAQMVTGTTNTVDLTPFSLARLA